MSNPTTVNSISELRDYVFSHPEEFTPLEESPCATKLRDEIAYQYKQHQVLLIGTDDSGKETAQIVITDDKFQTGPATGIKKFSKHILSDLEKRHALVTDDVSLDTCVYKTNHFFKQMGDGRFLLHVAGAFSEDAVKKVSEILEADSKEG